MDKPYLVECLDAVYDEEHGFLVLHVFFVDLAERRVITWHRDDFLFKGQRGVPDIEMRRTSKLIKGKKFKMVIQDDPNRGYLDEDKQMYYASLFNNRIADELAKVSEGLADEEFRISSRLDRMGKEGKLDFAKMYDKEQSLKNRLGLK